MPRVKVTIRNVVLFMFDWFFMTLCSDVIIFHEFEPQRAQFLEKGFVVVEHLVGPEMKKLALAMHTQTRCFINVKVIIGDDPGEVIQPTCDPDQDSLWPQLNVGVVEVMPIDQGHFQFRARLLDDHAPRADSPHL